MVDLIIATMRHERDYSDCRAVMLDKVVESIELSCRPGSYRIHVADDPGETWLQAVNRMMLETTGDVVNVDDDMWFHQDGWLDRYRHFMAQSGAGISVGKCLFPLIEQGHEVDSYQPGALQSAGNDLLPNGGGTFMHFMHPDTGQYQVVRSCAYACFAGCYISRSLIDQIGGLDLDMQEGCHFEDVEYALRAWNAGRTVMYTPTVEFIHYGTQTKGPTGQTDVVDRNRSYVMNKYGAFLHHIRRKTAPMAARG